MSVRGRRRDHRTHDEQAARPFLGLARIDLEGPLMQVSPVGARDRLGRRRRVGEPVPGRGRRGSVRCGRVCDGRTLRPLRVLRLALRPVALIGLPGEAAEGGDAADLEQRLRVLAALLAHQRAAQGAASEPAGEPAGHTALGQTG